MKKNGISKKLIFIYGFISTGKLTIASRLKKEMNYGLFHNHMIIDFMKGLFPLESTKKQKIREWLHLEITKKILKTNHSFIYTHAYFDPYVSSTGLSDPSFVKKIKKICEKEKVEFCPVFLTCNKKELVKRVSGSSRKKHGKLTDTKIFKKLLLRGDPTKATKGIKNFYVDTTKTDPRLSVQKIIKHYNLVKE